MKINICTSNNKGLLDRCIMRNLKWTISGWSYLPFYLQAHNNKVQCMLPRVHDPEY